MSIFSSCCWHLVLGRDLNGIVFKQTDIEIFVTMVTVSALHFSDQSRFFSMEGDLFLAFFSFVLLSFSAALR